MPETLNQLLLVPASFAGLGLLWLLMGRWRKGLAVRTGWAGCLLASAVEGIQFVSGSAALGFGLLTCLQAITWLASKRSSEELAGRWELLAAKAAESVSVLADYRVFVLLLAVSLLVDLLSRGAGAVSISTAVGKWVGAGKIVLFVLTSYSFFGAAGPAALRHDWVTTRRGEYLGVLREVEGLRAELVAHELLRDALDEVVLEDRRQVERLLTEIERQPTIMRPLMVRGVADDVTRVMSQDVTLRSSGRTAEVERTVERVSHWRDATLRVVGAPRVNDLSAMRGEVGRMQQVAELARRATTQAVAAVFGDFAGGLVGVGPGGRGSGLLAEFAGALVEGIAERAVSSARGGSVGQSRVELSFTPRLLEEQTTDYSLTRKLVDVVGSNFNNPAARRAEIAALAQEIARDSYTEDSEGTRRLVYRLTAKRVLRDGAGNVSREAALLRGGPWEIQQELERSKRWAAREQEAFERSMRASPEYRSRLKEYYKQDAKLRSRRSLRGH